MKKNLSLLALLLACTALYTAYSDNNNVPVSSSAAPATTKEFFSPAPDFSFTDIKGKKYSLEKFRGKAVVLNFLASWCAPCVIEFPQMVTLAAETKDDSVFIFLSQDDTAAEVESFIQKYGKGLPQKNIIVAQDKDKKIARNLYQTYKLPETYLIDGNGMMREKIIGAEIDWAGQTMRDKIKALR